MHSAIELNTDAVNNFCLFLYKSLTLRLLIIVIDEQKKTTKDIVRASVAEYLTFVTATGESNIQSFYADENVWLSQKMMGLLYDVEIPT